MYLVQNRLLIVKSPHWAGNQARWKLVLAFLVGKAKLTEVFTDRFGIVSRVHHLSRIFRRGHEHTVNIIVRSNLGWVYVVSETDEK